jgi:hypothetical protein
MKFIAKLIFLFAFTAILSGSASAQCTRHFYNNSKIEWRVGMTGGACGATFGAPSSLARLQR